MPTNDDDQLSNLTPIPMGRNVRGERREKRHDGRSLKTSICDLIDNSIDAGASEIFIMYETVTYREELKGALMIVDNGKGIPASKMLASLSFNSHRGGGYDSWELGSFGVGLDDSCLAHGQELTVFSRERGKDFKVVRLSCELTDRAENDWILVNNEDMLQNLPEAWNTMPFQRAFSDIDDKKKGTIVLLEDMDPLNEEIDENNTLDPLDEIENFIAMTFCDYLQGIDLGPRNIAEPLKIFFNNEDESIVPLDPFFKDQIGVGVLSGQQGTLMKPFPLEYAGMDFTINRFITPNKDERDRRCPGVDNRLVSAIGNTIDNCQGIYFKRNGRILDGPWNGENWRRTQGMGMGTNHHTAARWEFIMPSESINDPNMVPPDKRSVRTDVFQTAILNAKNESLIWHDEDEITYGSGTWADLTGGSIYTKRARSHNNSNDIPLFCLENGCETRIRHDRTLCAEHDVSRCSRCMQPLIETDENICQNCIENTCQTETCDYNVETQGDSYCLICQQPICEAFNCEERSIVQTEYCESHERQICKKIGCRSLNHSQFNKCEEHLTIFDGESGLQIKLVRLEHEGPMQINGQEILINLNDQSIRSIIMSVQEESMGMQDD